MNNRDRTCIESRLHDPSPTRRVALPVLAIPSSIAIGWFVYREGALATEHVLASPGLGQMSVEGTASLLGSTTTLSAIGLGLMVAVPAGCAAVVAAHLVRGVALRKGEAGVGR